MAPVQRRSGCPGRSPGSRWWSRRSWCSVHRARSARSGWPGARARGRSGRIASGQVGARGRAGPPRPRRRRRRRRPRRRHRRRSPARAQRELSFEHGDPPTGWSVRGPHRAAVADGQVVHGGARSLRIDAAGTGREFTAVSRVIPVDEVRGKKVRLVAWLRTEELDGQLGLWLRADGEVSGRPVAFGGTHATPLRGTTDWVRGEAAVEVPETASAFVLGAFVAGAGTAWIDDVEIAVTGSVAGRRRRAGRRRPLHVRGGGGAVGVHRHQPRRRRLRRRPRRRRHRAGRPRPRRRRHHRARHRPRRRSAAGRPARARHPHQHVRGRHLRPSTSPPTASPPSACRPPAATSSRSSAPA